MTDSSDEDYELPNLSERVQASFKSWSTLKTSKAYNSDSDESEFLKFSEKIRNTPCSQVKLNSCITADSESEEYEFLKFSEKIRNTPCSQVKLNSCITADSESEEYEFLKFSERIRNTPCSEVKNKLHFSSGSENEETEVLNFSERIRNTPRTQFRLENHYEEEDSNSDEEFSTFVGKIKKMHLSSCQKEKQTHKDSDSDSDEEFSNIITKIKEIHTPMSQNKYNKAVSDSFLSSVLDKKIQPDSSDYSVKALVSSEGTSSSRTVSQTDNEREYASLFPSRSDDVLFNKKRDFYTQTLFEFYNRKVFNNQLPKDIPLIWDASLVKTAGLTLCKAKKGLYSCSIKLSSKLLTSFDRFQDTLLHEMCHAAVWVINKQNVGHGPLWQVWASRSKLILPFIKCPERCHNYEIPYRFWYQCTDCKWKKGTCRRVKKYHGAMCKRCNTPLTMTVNN